MLDLVDYCVSWIYCYRWKTIKLLSFCTTFYWSLEGEFSSRSVHNWLLLTPALLLLASPHYCTFQCFRFAITSFSSQRLIGSVFGKCLSSMFIARFFVLKTFGVIMSLAPLLFKWPVYISLFYRFLSMSFPRPF